MRLNRKTILITGGTGSLGNKLVEKLLLFKPKEIRILSRSETLQDQMRFKFPNLKYILGDIRDYYSVKQAVRGCDLVIHAAAFKYLDLGQIQPRECVMTNVVGSLNVIQACKEEGIKTCVGISTDKAPYARNVYGCTKQIMEKLLEEAGYNWVRYGNVIGTNGSVIPKWLKLKQEGKPLLITDKRMTRFFFTLDEAANAVFKCIKEKRNIIPEMKSLKIYDLAKAISDNVKIIGLRPGEKLHETLVADYEGKELSTKTAKKFTKNEIKQIVEAVINGIS